MGAGKSTIASLLSETLRLPRCCYDELKLDYLAQVGFDLSEAQRLRDIEGVYEMCMYTNQFGISVLERLLEENPGHIIDLGAGSYCFENESQVARARRAFRPIHFSVLLKPSPDLAECIANLPGVRERRYMNTYFIMHPLNETLSTHTVYTLGKTPEETAGEVAAIVQGRGA
jgi:shikimate kinase